MAISKKLRFAVLNKHGFVCYYCGRRPPQIALEIDHKIPVAKGGLDSLLNLVPACQECNRGKGTEDIEINSWNEWDTGEYCSWEHFMEYRETLLECYNSAYHEPTLPWMVDRTIKPMRLDFDFYPTLAETPRSPIPTAYPAPDQEPF